MADNLSNLALDLQKVEDAARAAEARIASLRKELEKLVEKSVRGGVATRAGISRVTTGILAGEIDPTTQRARVEGGGRISTAAFQKEAENVRKLVAEYQALTNVLREAEQQAATIRGALYTNPSVVSARKAQPIITGLPNDLTPEDILAAQAAQPTTPMQGKTLEKTGMDAEKAARGMDQLYLTMARLVELQQKFPEAFAQINAQMEKLGDSSARTSMRVRELPGGVEKFSASIRAGGETFGPYVQYIDKAGNELTEFEAKQRAATATQQKFTQEQLQAILAEERYRQANRMARGYGFQPAELTQMRTQQPSGVTFLRYEKVNELTGGVNRLDLAVDRVGRTITQTNRRFLDFFSAIARNTAEVIRWSIGATAVYSTLFKLQDLVRTAITNEAALADITVTLGDNQRSVNEIFEDASKIANETGENISGVLEAYTLAYRAVGSVEDPIRRTTAANKLLNDSIILAKLSALDQAQSIDVLAGAIRQLQQPNESFDDALERGTRLLDQWVAVTRKANVDLATIATAFSITAESADNAGVSTEELTAIIASLSEKIGGLGGRETGNAVRALIGGVYQGQAAEALGRYGIAITDVNGKMRDFLDIMREVASLRNQELISSDQLNKLGYVLGGGVRRGQQYIAFLDDLARIDQIVAYQTNAQGIAQEALGKKLDTVQTSVTRLSNSFQGLAQALGDRGGILDTSNAILVTMTSLNEIISTITRTLGRVTVPAALLALASAYFRGPQGVLRGQEARLGISGYFGGLATGALGILPGMGQPRGPNGMLFAPGVGINPAQQLGTRFGDFAARMGPALILGMLPAISRMGQELTARDKWKAVGIDLAGGVIGAIVGGPIGALVGSSIAESFVSAVVDYKPTLQDFFADMFPKPPEEKTKEARIAEAENIQNTLFARMGQLPYGIGQSRDLGKFASVIGAEMFNALSKLNKAVGLGGFGQLTPAQVSLIRATPAERAAIGRLYKETPQPMISAPTPVATDEEKRIIQRIQDQARQTQLQQLYKRELKPAEYLRNQLDIQGFLALLPQLENAFGQTFDEISDDISGTDEVYQALADTIIQGSEEDLNYIKSLAGEIEDLKSTIDTANEAGRGFIEVIDALGKTSQISIGEATDQLNQKVQMLANTFAALRKEQRMAEVNLPQNIQLEISPQYLDKVIQEARRLEGLYLAALTPEEREKYEAEQAVAKYLIEMWAKGGQIAYQAINKMGLGFAPPGAEFITQAAQGLIGAGQIPQAGKNVGIENINATYAQFAQAMEGYGALLSQLVQAGYTPDEQYQVAVFQDGIIRPMSKDWKIVQMLLQDILDTEKDQLEGIYNLPEGASFYVPFQGYKLGFGQQGGGMGNIDWNAIPGDMEDSTYRGTYQGILDSMGFKTGEERKLAREERSSFLKEKTTMSPVDIKRLEYPTSTIPKIPGFTVPEQKPTPFDIRSIPGYTPEIKVPEPTGIDLVGVTIENAIKTMSTTLDTKLGEANSYLSKILDALNRGLGVEPGRPTVDPLGKGLRGLQSPTQTPLSYLTQTRNIPKVETKLSLNINSNIQLMVDGRMLAAIIKQYLYEDLIRSEGIAGSITRTIVI